MERDIRRPVPDEQVRETRTRNLLVAVNGVEVQGLEPELLPEPGFERGNKKTGERGGVYNNIMVWNIPTLSTCPGASEWCKSVCYNGDDRPDIFLEDKWKANLAGFNADPDALAELLKSEIDASEHPLAIRIHSSGDFFSEQYIQFWDEIITEYPDVTFWAYTRSWAVTQLREPLESLKTKENLQLFASWDATMSPPPPDWRASYVQDPLYPIEPPNDATRCPEEFMDDMNCARCGFCLRDIGRGVLFNVH